MKHLENIGRRKRKSLAIYLYEERKKALMKKELNHKLSVLNVNLNFAQSGMAVLLIDLIACMKIFNTLNYCSCKKFTEDKIFYWQVPCVILM